MNGLRAISCFYSRTLLRGRVQGCRTRTGNCVNYALRCMSHNTPCLKNNLPQTNESTPRELEEFGQFDVQKKPFVATSLAELADSSPILQKLIDLGVEIYKFNSNWDLCKFILNLDFKRDVEPYLSFLKQYGIENETVGQYLTSNPYILTWDLDDLQVRINYLQSKRFTKSMINQIICGNPKWLSYQVKTIDSKLGDLQKMLKLSGNEVRTIVVNYPKIVNIEREKLQLNVIVFTKQLELSNIDVKKVLTKKPVLLSKDPNDTVHSYYYLTDEMNVQSHLIVEQPEVLLCRRHILSNRHKFLVKLGRAQYNPRQPGYVSLHDLSSLNDEKFCENIARTELSVYHNFQKTL